ncbi:DUF4097 family beta strand repeat-containing protein [Paenibacillus spiritus]|uniref:DUF4097 family beta strand repeat-containing protein n=1 Tax=Paenibacillus spiritus TaxID=2496557 RepID=UPI001CC4B1B4|nr:DUF4097 family beta strand repeat-containing protein [Paenibacillus spiritus]
MKQDSRTWLSPEERAYFEDRSRAGSGLDREPEETVDSDEEPVIPPRPKQRRYKRKFTAGLLAALIPGTGHLYFGLIRKGISIVFLIILDIAALLYFSSIGIQINVPLLILLGLLIPVIYFYNVYDALQTADRLIRHHLYPPPAPSPEEELASPPRRRSMREPDIRFGLLLVMGGALLALFTVRPLWLRTFVDHQAAVGAGAALLIGALLTAVCEIARRSRPMEKDTGRWPAGRFTAAAVLAGVGYLLLEDWRSGSDDLLLLLKWWPVIPVLWGMEYLATCLTARRHGRRERGVRTRPDLKGVFLSVLLGASVFVVAEQEHYLHLWNKVSLNLTAAAAEYGEAQGSRFVKPALRVPVELNTAKLAVESVNGDILIHRSAVKDIEITATVWVDQLEGAQAEAIAEQSFLQVDPGPTIGIVPKLKTYGESGKRQPRMDLDIAVPDTRRFNLELETMNGDITLQNVEAIREISLATGNGKLILNRVFGEVKGKTLNGEVRAREVQGNVELTSGGGAMYAWDINGGLKLTTAVGSIGVERSGSEVELSTKNGDIRLDGARAALKAETLNGAVDIAAPVVGGDWSVYSAVGDIRLRLPADGNYELQGSSGYGNIESTLPGLKIEKKTITGKLGTGEFHLSVEGNSNLNVRTY